MTQFFNPYHEWLGIAADNRTPHHYDLLGIDLYESDLSAIALAADGRIALLGEHQHGPHAESLQNLLAEVVHARKTLLDEQARGEYEAALREQIKSLRAPPPPEEVDPAGVTGESTDAALSQLERVVTSDEHLKKRRKRGRLRHRGPEWLAWLTAATLAALAGVGTVVLLRSADNRANQPSTQVSPPQPVPAPASSPKPPEPEAFPPVDLLALVDPVKHTLIGHWKRDRDVLEMIELPENSLLLPYSLPDSYRLSVTVSRTDDSDAAIRVLLPCSNQFIYLMISDARAGFCIDGLDALSNELTVEKPLLVPGTAKRLEFDVSEARFILSCDGEDLLNWEIAPDRLVLPQHELNTNKIQRRDCVVVSADRANFKLSELMLSPRSQGGQPIDIDFDRPLSHNGHSYKRIKTETHTWRQAVRACEEMGGHLVCVETPEELEFLRDQVLHHRPTWLGAMRINADSEFGWINGAEMKFADWWKDVEDRSESYLMCEGAEAKWRDRPESSRLAFVCEWESPEPTPPKKDTPSFLTTLLPTVPDDKIGEPRVFDGHKYAMIAESMSWHDAQAVCEQMGGHLCCVETEDEHTFLESLVLAGQNHWLGGTDEAQEGEWQWVTGGPIDLAYWDDSEPNNGRYRGEHSLILLGAKAGQEPLAGVWKDHSSSDRFNFICEWDTEVVAYLDLLPQTKPWPVEKMDPRRRVQLAAELQNEYESQLAKKTRRQRAAVAAHWIELAAEEQDPVRKFVLLDQATVVAAKNSGLAMAMLARDQLDQSFPSNNASTRRIELLQEATSRVESTLEAVWDVQEILEAAGSVVANSRSADDFEQLEQLYSSLERSSRKLGKPLSNQVLRQKEFAATAGKMLKTLAESEAALKNDPAAAKAHRVVGEHSALVLGDWKTALESLSKSNAGPLAAAANKCIAAPDDYSNQIEIASAWWDLAESTKRDDALKEMRLEAARYWYRTAMPRASKEDRPTIETRLTGGRRRLPSGGAFTVVTHGVGDVPQIRPEQLPTGKVSPAGGFAMITDGCNITYPAIPASEFVHELEFVMGGPEGGVTIDYGRHEGGKFDVVWQAEQQAFEYHFNHHWGGPKGPIKPGERVTLILYVRPGDWHLYRGDRLLGRIGPPCEDLRFRILGHDKCKMQIFRCEFRPLSIADPLKPLQTEPSYSAAATAQEILAQEFAMDDKPSVKTPDRYLVTTTGTSMRWIPAGKFIKDFDYGRRSTVEISRGFWIGAYEITQREWLQIASRNLSRSFGSPWLPVDGVSWSDAGVFCAKLTELEKRAGRLPSGYVYRLPTESEWEYACRSGVPDTHSIQFDKFWHQGTADFLQEVGRSSANAWGLYDMHGNVSEWCLDAFQEFPETPPALIRDRLVPPLEGTNLFVMRGGQWWQQADQCSSASRARKENVPAEYCGFRIVLAPAIGKIVPSR